MEEKLQDACWKVSRKKGLAYMQTDLGLLVVYDNPILKSIKQIKLPSNMAMTKDEKGPVYLVPQEKEEAFTWEEIVPPTIKDKTFFLDWEIFPPGSPFPWIQPGAPTGGGPKLPPIPERIQKLVSMPGFVFLAISKRVAKHRMFYLVAFGTTAGSIENKDIQITKGVVFAESPAPREDATYCVEFPRCGASWVEVFQHPKADLRKLYKAKRIMHRSQHWRNICKLHGKYVKPKKRGQPSPDPVF